MVASPELDAVAVVVRVPSHYAPAKASLEAGKHVYCEWPLGRTTAEAIELLQHSPLHQLVITNTIPLPEAARNDKIQVLTVAPLLAEAIKRIHEHESVSALFT